MKPDIEILAEAEPMDEPKSFEEFFADCYEPLLRALYLVTGVRHEAEELAQEACLRVYERWDTLQTTANPAGYAYRAALNIRRSKLRRLATAARTTFKRDEPDALVSIDQRDAIRRALLGIPVGQREALVLMDWAGFTDQETAEVLGITAEAVRMRLSRARRTLRELLGQGETDE
jgi:RNA polymerase sigma factor (sigma-70 family)